MSLCGWVICILFGSVLFFFVVGGITWSRFSVLPVGEYRQRFIYTGEVSFGRSWKALACDTPHEHERNGSGPDGQGILRRIPIDLASALLYSMVYEFGERDSMCRWRFLGGCLWVVEVKKEK